MAKNAVWKYSRKIYDRAKSRIRRQPIFIALLAIPGFLVSAAIGAVVYATFYDPNTPLLFTALETSVAIFGLVGIFIVLLTQIVRLDVEIQKSQSIDINSIPKEKLAFHIAEDLSTKIIKDISENSNINHSVFSVREDHYRDEKRFLAKYFVNNFLEERILEIKKRFAGGRKIRLMCDSGSTISPIMKELGAAGDNDDKYWASDIRIETNNIPGLRYLLQYRASRDDRYSPLPLRDVFVIEGSVAAPFDAIIDDHAVASILQDRERKKKEYYTISLITGNYIIYHRNFFLPISRFGKHTEIKSALYSISDEVYLVAPLGKILCPDLEHSETHEKLSVLERLLAEFNTDLGYLGRHDGSKVLEKEKEYRLVNPNLVEKCEDRSAEDLCLEWMKKSVLFTTERTDTKDIMFKHFSRVNGGLSHCSPMWNPGTGYGHILSPVYSNLPSYQAQIELEVPHENIRNHLSKYFGI